MIGVSGAVASGKSTVAEILAELVGGTLVSADAIAHEVLAGDAGVQRAIAERWGNACLDGSGGIARAKLAEIVFNSPDDLAELNRIIHPAILRRIREQIDAAHRTAARETAAHRTAARETAAHRTAARETAAHGPARETVAHKGGSPWIIVDAALLFETGLDAICDVRICVQSDWSVRAERARRDRGWSEDELRRRDAAQMPADRKVALSDYTASNNGSRYETKRQIEAIVQHIERHRRKFNGQREST